MQFCGSLLLSGLMSITLLLCSVDSFRVQHRAQHIDRPMSASFRARSREVKEGEGLRVKLLPLDNQIKMENDVMEPKRKRSFPGNSSPLDRLSISSMETKQMANKKSKVLESPRQRVNSPPIDRIGMNRLPNSRG